MKKLKIEPVKRPLATVLGIVWGIVIVVLAVSIYGIFNYDQGTYYSKPEFYTAEVLGKDYGMIYSGMDSFEKNVRDVKNHPEYGELIAVRDYVENFARYRMYTENGDGEKASKYLEAMNDAKTRLKALDFTVEEIEKLLNR